MNMAPIETYLLLLTIFCGVLGIILILFDRGKKEP